MSAFLGGLQFSYPWVFGLALLPPLLIFAYRQKNPLKTKTVSSLIIIDSLKDRPIKKKRVRPPLSFLLELLALLCLIGAASLPLKINSDLPVAVIVDTSLSMRAKDPSPSNSNRLNLAKKKAEENLSNDFRYTLYASSPTLRPASSSSLSKRALLSEIEALPLSLASDSLPSSIEALGASGEFRKVVVLTDRTWIKETLDPEGPEKEAEGAVELEVLQVGTPSSNAYITELRVTRQETGESSLEVSTNYSGSGNIAGTLVLSKASEPKRELERKSISITSGQTLGSSFDLPPTVKSLKVEFIPITQRRDALPEDNTAWIATEVGGKNRILLVSPSSPKDSTLGLESIPGSSPKRIRPEEYARLDTQDLSKYSLLIFHESAPRIPPRTPSLFILPPDENPVFEVRSEVESPSITSWLIQHPITSYLKTSLLSPSRALVFSPPPWGQSVIGSEKGSLIVSGESQGIRFAAVGFELLPFEGRSSPALSILLLNTVGWLSGSENLSDTLLTGSKLQKQSFESILSPMQEELVDKNEDESLVLEQTGIYQAKKKDQSTELIAVNAFHPLESDTMNVVELKAASSIPTFASSTDKQSNLWSNLILLAVVLLFLQMILRSVFKR